VLQTMVYAEKGLSSRPFGKAPVVQELVDQGWLPHLLQEVGWGGWEYSPATMFQLPAFVLTCVLSEYENRIMPAESEGVGHSGPDSLLSGDVGYIIEIAFPGPRSPDWSWVVLPRAG